MGKKSNAQLRQRNARQSHRSGRGKNGPRPFKVHNGGKSEWAQPGLYSSIERTPAPNPLIGERRPSGGHNNSDNR